MTTLIECNTVWMMF